MNIKIKIDNLKKIRIKLKNSKTTIGTFMQINSSEIAEILSNTKFEWVALDMEHGTININDLNNIFRAIEINNKLPIVRLSSKNIIDCRKVLDYGACGVIIPIVENKLELENIIRNCKFPPHGSRGVAFIRSNNYGKEFDKYYNKLSKLKLIIAMIESVKGIENLDEILQTKFLDAIFIGPYDLSASLGCPGDFKNKIFIKALKKIKTECKKYNIPLGIHVVEPNRTNLQKIIEEGYNFIAYSMDTRFIINSLDNFN